MAHAESAEALSGNGRFILPLQAFLDLDPELRESAKERLGVLLQPGDQLERSPVCSTSSRWWRWRFRPSMTAAASPRLNCCAAARLRGPDPRHRPSADRPAAAMLRLGFNEFEVSHPVLITRLEEGETGGIPLYYQPTAKPSGERREIFLAALRDRLTCPYLRPVDWR